MSRVLWPSLWDDEPTRPLKNLRVLDFTEMLGGTLMSRILVQHGAEVIKLENLPSGDPLRHVQNTAVWQLLNQGKKSLALDLRATKSIAAVVALASECDVFIESSTDRSIDQLGLGYAELSEHNSDLIYVSVRGSAQRQEISNEGDLNSVASSGCGQWFLENSSPNYSTFFAEIVGGAFIPTMRLLAQLAGPHRRGMHLRCAIDEGFRALYLPRAYDSVHAEKLPESERRQFGLEKTIGEHKASNRWYRSQDGQLMSLGALSARQWASFCEIIGRPDWSLRQEDPTLVDQLAACFADRPMAYWESLFEGKGVGCVPVLGWGELLRMTDSRTQLLSDPLRWCGFTSQHGIAEAPALGRDSFSILSELGWSHKDISETLGPHPSEEAATR